MSMNIFQDEQVRVNGSDKLDLGSEGFGMQGLGFYEQCVILGDYVWEQGVCRTWFMQGVWFQFVVYGILGTNNRYG